MSVLTEPQRPADRSFPVAIRSQHERILAAAGALVVACAAALYIWALLNYSRRAMLYGFDLRVYRLGGFLAIHDPAELYTAHLQGGYGFTYTPFAALVFAPIAGVGLKTLMNASVLVSVGALIATASISARALGLTGRTRLAVTLLISGMGFWTEPVQRAVFFGQVDVVLMAVVVWDLCQPNERRLKGFATGIVAGIKLVPLIFVIYLLITRRFRQAVLACAGFASTVVVGFVALPSESTQWWVHGDFLGTRRIGFVGSLLNQSLRGFLTRLAASPSAGAQLWIPAAGVVGLLGLAAAATLHRSGRTFEGLTVCVLTALLISPISWDHHWVWIVPGLVILVAASIRATRVPMKLAWAAAAVLLEAAFLAWPKLWTKTPKLLHSGLLQYAPGTRPQQRHSPRYVAEYHWHGVQLLAGNLYVLVGSVILLCVLGQMGLRLSRPQARMTALAD